jgi:hypothetical protein
VAYPPSMPSYRELAHMRKRGQRPLGPIWVTDDAAERRRVYEHFGLFPVPLPKLEQAYLLAGLWVHMYAQRTEDTMGVAAWITAAGPKRFTIKWIGERWDTVIGVAA